MTSPPKYILAIDEGTTSVRAIIFDQDSRIIGLAQQEINKTTPKDGWVEQDALEILEKQMRVAKEVLRRHDIHPKQVAAIGITNQRETTVVWDKNSGRPIYNAVVWQDRRTAGYCDDLKAQGFEPYVKEATGLVLDPYFSGTKLKWILDHVAVHNPDVKVHDLCFGTIDSWLIWHMTGGKVHATDYSNASRTLLYNINSLEWDSKILRRLNIPQEILPEVRPSSGDFGTTDPSWFDGVEIPIRGVAGDQQAALFGQACFDPGMSKNTYGTGCFMLMNTGTKRIVSENGLLSTLAWGINGKVYHALEGSVFVAGAAIQWLRDSLKIIDAAPDSEYYAGKVPGSEGVYVVPAFPGLGAHPGGTPMHAERFLA
jgi:glycerol kinase